MLRSREQAPNLIVQTMCFVKELPVSKAGKTFMVFHEVFFFRRILSDFFRSSHRNQLHWIDMLTRQCTPTI